MSDLKVTTGDTIGYGYVYFNDGKRIGFAEGVENRSRPFGMFPGNWGDVTEEHFKLAEKWLTDAKTVNVDATDDGDDDGCSECAGEGWHRSWCPENPDSTDDDDE